METYKIVDAVQLEEDLTQIADSLRAKRGEEATAKYTFPDTYVSAIEDLYYNDTPKVENDIVVEEQENGTYKVTIPAGFYTEPIEKIIGTPTENS